MPRALGKGAGQDMSRLRRFAANHLGVIMGDQVQGSADGVNQFRDPDLNVLDLYYEGKQYDGMQNWEEAARAEEYVPVRSRRPRIVYNLPKVMVDKVASKLCGSAMFPQFSVEGDDDDTAFYRTVVKSAKLRGNLLDPIKHALACGSVFVRYFLVAGSPMIEYSLSKYCWPVFDDAGALESIEIKYVYEDGEDRTAKGDPKLKWYRLVLDKFKDTEYNNPEFKVNTKPEFEVANQNEHNLGFVQGEWITTHKDKHDPNGVGIYALILDFCDELNYSLSQTSQSVGYNQEPQLVVNGVDEDELNQLVRSTQKAWNLGKDGKAAYVNSEMKGVETAELQRDHMRGLALDVARICIHDPEKMAGAAQSGAALMILNAPLVELVDELRTVLEPSIVSLIIKIAVTLLHYMSLGQETAITVPPGYIPQSSEITCAWPAVYPPTLADIMSASTAASSLSTGKIISRESLTRWIAAMIPSIDNVEEELQKIAAEPDLPSPFGSFGG